MKRSICDLARCKMSDSHLLLRCSPSQNKSAIIVGSPWQLWQDPWGGVLALDTWHRGTWPLSVTQSALFHSCPQGWELWQEHWGPGGRSRTWLHHIMGRICEWHSLDNNDPTNNVIKPVQRVPLNSSLLSDRSTARRILGHCKYTANVLHDAGLLDQFGIPVTFLDVKGQILLNQSNP